jgi:hypothetical protein
VNPGRGVVGDKYVKRCRADARHIATIDDLGRPPIMGDSAVALVDREGAAKETEIESAKPEPTTTWQIRDPFPNRDRPRTATVLGERRMVVMVAVDEPHLDSLRHERRVDVVEKAVASNRFARRSTNDLVTLGVN